MDKKTSFIFPGQGAQYVGMGQDFYKKFSIVREMLEETNDRLGFNLSKLIFEGPSEELKLTKNSQIAIYVISVAFFRVLEQQFPEIVPSVVAGLSLGEYSALTVSGRLAFGEGIDLVKARGEYMHEAGIKYPGTMVVVLGMNPEEVSVVSDALQGVRIANLNCPGQVVISGTIQGIREATSLLKKKGAKRILPLDVSGAFHSELMEDAKSRLKKKIDLVTLNASEIELVMNACGDFVTQDEIRKNMIKQVVAPVYWEKGICKMEKRGVEIFIEIGPGTTLSGMNRKIKVKGQILNIGKIEDLERLHQGVNDGVT